MTIEMLAEIIQKDFKDIRERMATKEDLARFATKEYVEEVRDYVVSKNNNALYELKTELLTEIRKYHYAREIDNLRGRITRVEKKIGLYVEPNLDLEAE